MIYELRSHQLRVGALTEYLALEETKLPPALVSLLPWPFRPESPGPLVLPFLAKLLALLRR